MTSSDLPRLTALLKRLCAVYGRFYGEALLEGYTVGLRDADIDQVECNGIAWLTIGKGMPTPYDLSRAADEVSNERQAIAMWQEVAREIRSGKGALDRVARELVEGFGGTRALGNMDSVQLHSHIRREFVQSYTAAVRDEELRELAASLKGRDKQLPA